jgi:hypothetical protein
MKIWLSLALLPLAGCYTQLYTRGYAERSAYPYPYQRSVGDSVLADSLSDSLAAADSARGAPNTVIVNNYYQERDSYRGYPINEWDYPYISLGFYSGRYRDYYGPYWWNDPYYHRRGYWRRYDGHAGGGSGPTGPYHSDKRLFAPAPAQPLHKGRRSEPAAEPAPAPAPKAADPAPAESSGSSSGSSSSTSDGGTSSGSSSGSTSGSPSGSGNDHPDLHKGRRR